MSTAARRVIVQGRAKRGLFHGKQIQFGHQICFSAKKGKRSWSPNVQHKKIWSDALQHRVRIPVTVKALRCIDRAGGLDNYLMTTKPHLLGEGIGIELRQAVMEIKAKQQKLAFKQQQRQKSRAALSSLVGEIQGTTATAASSSSSEAETESEAEAENLEVLNLEGEVVGQTPATQSPVQ